MKVKVAADHFVKVRGLIKDLIKRLEDDASSEEDQKSFCDKKMAAALANRDKANSQIEVAVSQITKLNHEKAALEADIQGLEQAIADNLKALNEATELREAEKAENEATLETAEEGKTAVELALSILKQFYDNAFVQIGYVPPNSDREGLTVADRAPEVWSGTYHGSQSNSKGILGLLEVIQSDFERTIAQTTEDENTSQTAFETLESDIKADNEAATTLKEDAEAELTKLKPMCVEGEETYAQRVAKREKEIAALKEAMVILDEWQK